MSESKNKVKLFESQQVRTEWDEVAEKWWFSVVDIIAVLTEQADYTKARNYWKWLKKTLLAEGSQLVSNTHQLKMPASDGKKYLTDVTDTEQILRLIQSIPSKKAEPFKLWLAKVGNERIDESIDPELSIDRAIQSYRRLGYSESWINQRIKSIEVRKALTDEWDKSGVKQGKQYADLTDLMSQTWSGLTTRQYKQHKGLKKENLRDNMTNTELVLNMLAEVAATDIAAVQNPKGYHESASVAKEGAKTAKAAREQLEKSTGKSAISALTAKDLGQRKISGKKTP
ncbi:Bro-N domain-containing protein [Limnohabitans sp.]|uniref:BRO-N domain-containing protein n=1 Tax=Limnohabitans sp. TaxID=1907725 RepID=UPI00286F3C85|nr:Bro-N domain-containing protein [Limnohabitans sp.]